MPLSSGRVSDFVHVQVTKPNRMEMHTLHCKNDLECMLLTVLLAEGISTIILKLFSKLKYHPRQYASNCKFTLIPPGCKAAINT
eukprot:5767930-Amphidinium_carterae.1